MRLVCPRCFTARVLDVYLVACRGWGRGAGVSLNDRFRQLLYVSDCVDEFSGLGVFGFADDGPGGTGDRVGGEVLAGECSDEDIPRKPET